MVAALERIRAGRAARLIRDINAFIPEGTPSAENEARRKPIESLPPEAERLGRDREAIFDEWTPDGGRRLLVAQVHDFYNI
ncbi:MAG: hypothetical protein ACLQGP_01295 [Isosphaeraceae bacterium]